MRGIVVVDLDLRWQRSHPLLFGTVGLSSPVCTIRNDDGNGQPAQSAKSFHSRPLVSGGRNIYNFDAPGRGAVWLARLNGVQEVGGSNPLAPTRVMASGPL